MKQLNDTEVVLGDVPEINVPEINISYSRTEGRPFLGTITTLKDVADFIRSTFDTDTLELQEQLVVLYLNRANDIIGYYRHAKGGISEVVSDSRIILGVALKCGAVSLIIAHNHPAQSLLPSNADLKVTDRLKKAAAINALELIDHLIITRTGYYSFAKHRHFGLSGVENLGSPIDRYGTFVQKVEGDVQSQVPHNKRSIEKLAGAFGISDKTLVKELTELAIVNMARKLAHSNGDTVKRFDRIVELYSNQVTLSHRTSQSILLQQYSTPAPIAYLMGVFCGIDRQAPGQSFFEPSAGNGLLTIAGSPKGFTVNEIDPVRNKNLQTQGFSAITAVDATAPFTDYAKRFDAVLTNPPFGKLETKVLYETFAIQPLEHVMALRALDCMKDEGRAAIIIGGHTRWDEEGRIQAGKNRIFFNYLYSRYHVAAVINIDGHKLYSRQGTAFDVRLILINGRKKTPAGAAPLQKRGDTVVTSFNDLFDRVSDALTAAPVIHPQTNPMRLYELEAEALALELELLKPMNGLGEALPFNINRHTYQLYQQARNKHRAGHRTIILIKTGWNLYETFDTDAERLVYMFSLPVSLFSVIRGKKVYGTTVTPEKLVSISDRLTSAGYQLLLVNKDGSLGTLDAPYQPASQACTVFNTQVPDSMAYETQAALQLIKEEVGGDMDNFVRHRLKYPSKASLCNVLSAEQIDAVAMAIYNIEARNQGMVIGDQTGIGKGRVAAAMIRYGVLHGVKPVFLTEKANLFSDIYRDLAAIGSAHLRPLIINTRETKTDIKDEDGEVVYQAPPPAEQQSIIQSHEIPARYDFVMATYSQFNSLEKKPEKPQFLMRIAQSNLFVMDEAHNASGASNTGEFLQSAVANTRGVVFLSATFAKRPDNMPIYAMKTAIADCNMSKLELVDAITRGGVALQEVLSAQLVSEGQMLRRERSFEGVEVNYINLDDKAEEHRAIADNITTILRDIIGFQLTYVDNEVKQLDKIAAAESKEVGVRKGTSQAGVDNTPYFSKVFNVINQMLFSLKAEAVAEKTIDRLREGKKPVIAFSSTMGSFIETMGADTGMQVTDGDTVNADFAEVLRRGLDGVLRYTEKDVNGDPIYKKFSIDDFSPEAQAFYHRILENIDSVSTGITISPIDVIVKKIRAAGYSVVEVTGRKFELQLNAKGSKGLVLGRKRVNTNDAFRQFNNNEVDVLLINQSGSTGASAHAIPTAKVPASEVQQRVMIVLQAELDISTEVQKRGRINRTGQLLKPIYDYVSSAIPAEKRLMMMLQKKLKSLDANTTSNQKQSSKILDVPDFLNKYGDKVVMEYLQDNPEVNKLLDDPLYLGESAGDGGGSNTSVREDAAMKVSGRVAVLSTQMQEDFYGEIIERYKDYVEYLQQVGEYDLEVEAMDLEAETVSAKMIKMGKGTGSPFGDDSMLETVKANVLKKPFSRLELENILNESLKGQDAQEQQQAFINEYLTETEKKLEELQGETEKKYAALIKEIPNENGIKKLERNPKVWAEAIKEREKELTEAQEAVLLKNQKTFTNRRAYMEKALRYFYIGRYLSYPMESFIGNNELVPAVFLGYLVDRKKKNPYAASAIKMRFAIANSSKYLAIPASYSENIMAIIGASSDLVQPDLSKLLDAWEKHVKEQHVDRKTRHIVTGNLLQAFSDQKGKLVSYTTLDGQVKKGILLPEYWEPAEQLQDKVVVPILKTLPIIKSLPVEKFVVTNNGLSIFRMENQYKLIISGARSKGGDIYLDKDILPLVDKNNFEKVSDKMVAHLPVEKIGQLVAALQNNHSCSITIQTHQLKELQKSALRVVTRKKIDLPPDAKEDETIPSIRILELEAEALALELELLAA